jgi:hypothetical protein
MLSSGTVRGLGVEQVWSGGLHDRGLLTVSNKRFP